VKPDATVAEPSQARVSDNDKTPNSAENPTAPDNFGTRTVDAPMEHVEAIIVEVTTSAHKIDYLRLDNGQIWRENEDNRIRFKSGQKVKIEVGILSSFNLTTDGSNKILKVRRVK